MIWATESLLSLPMTRRGNSSSNDSLSLYAFLMHESFGTDDDPEMI